MLKTVLLFKASFPDMSLMPMGSSDCASKSRIAKHLSIAGTLLNPGFIQSSTDVLYGKHMFYTPNGDPLSIGQGGKKREKIVLQGRQTGERLAGHPDSRSPGGEKAKYQILTIGYNAGRSDDIVSPGPDSQIPVSAHANCLSTGSGGRRGGITDNSLKLFMP